MMEDLTRKETGFVKEYVKTGNGTQSALKVYDTNSENVAGVIAHENLSKPKIQNAIKSIADKIPDELLEKVHLEGLNAGKTVYKNNNSSGEIEEVGYEPDYAVRHKYLDTAYKLKKLYDDGDETRRPIVVPVLVQFLDKKDGSTDNNQDTHRIQ